MAGAVRDIGIGIIAGGSMGKARSVAMVAVGAAFDTSLHPRLGMIVASNAVSADRLGPDLPNPDLPNDVNFTQRQSCDEYSNWQRAVLLGH